jgi:hypothetical protein
MALLCLKTIISGIQNMRWIPYEKLNPMAPKAKNSASQK